jgi:hypothetical protein
MTFNELDQNLTREELASLIGRTFPDVSAYKQYTPLDCFGICQKFKSNLEQDKQAVVGQWGREQAQGLRCPSGCEPSSDCWGCWGEDC